MTVPHFMLTTPGVVASFSNSNMSRTIIHKPGYPATFLDSVNQAKDMDRWYPGGQETGFLIEK